MEYNTIKKVLERTGKSQKWLSDQIKVSVVTVNFWCSNKSCFEMVKKKFFATDLVYSNRSGFVMVFIYLIQFVFLLVNLLRDLGMPLCPVERRFCFTGVLVNSPHHTH